MRIREPDGTVRTFTNEARRAQIMHAAIETIAEHGFAGATFARITERAGLSSPRLISYHFGSKDGLIQQIVVEIYTSAARFMAERIQAEETAAGRLRAYLESNLEYLRDHARDMAALTEIGPHLRTPAGEPYTSQTAQEPGVLGLEELLRAGQDSGEFRDFDLRSMALVIRGAVEAAAQRLRGGPGLDFDAYRREVVTTFTLATRRT
ncbi:TetR/AcrR family transcriptional regulator [Streptomyces sp. TS71-3]|uniref:TetR/AcrR family transcriptional regulator n=1 Tax=Streptomyces sp. TS71-3 TaxID=2733862 RepID=UPI001B149785|nr:TetR/AcrR family transcriptional regulator [Streptomyces sp. TS71-3]GHJ36182.1 TetR family transcriptional regulator [Streptomyces sp. TS71-3]